MVRPLLSLEPSMRCRASGHDWFIPSRLCTSHIQGIRIATPRRYSYHYVYVIRTVDLNMRLTTEDPFELVACPPDEMADFVNASVETYQLLLAWLD